MATLFLRFLVEIYILERLSCNLRKLKRLFASSLTLTRNMNSSNSPRKPKNAFFLFAEDCKRMPNMNRMAHESHNEFAKETNRLWKILPNSTKLFYYNKAADDLANYKKVMAAEAIKSSAIRLIQHGHITQAQYNAWVNTTSIVNSSTMHR